MSKKSKNVTQGAFGGKRKANGIKSKIKRSIEKDKKEKNRALNVQGFRKKK